MEIFSGNIKSLNFRYEFSICFKKLDLELIDIFNNPKVLCPILDEDKSLNSKEKSHYFRFMNLEIHIDQYEI